MAHYIDKAAVVAEIKKRRKDWQYGSSVEAKYKKEECDDILSLFNTLEVKEINFEDIKSVFDRQYLSKDKVVTTIERLQDECEEQGNNNGVELLEKLFNKLDTLEVKEVALEKIINDYFKDWKFDDELDIMVKPNNYSASFADLKDIARHFFELGIKTQIMTPKLQQRIGVLKMEFWTGLQTFEETEITLSDAYNQGVDDVLEELGLKAQKGE